MGKNSKVKNLRPSLIREVQKHLIPVFLEKGFSVVPLRPEEMNSEMKWLLPLGRLKRNRGKYLDVVSVTFGKYTPSFVIDFGVIPEEGVSYPWIHLDQNVATVADVPDAYRLYSSSLLPRWFKLGLFVPKNKNSIEKVVDEAIRFSEEIYNWFEFKTVGRHMRRYDNMWKR